jgi:hypothetical protein
MCRRAPEYSTGLVQQPNPLKGAHRQREAMLSLVARAACDQVRSAITTTAANRGVIRRAEAPASEEREALLAEHTAVDSEAGTAAVPDTVN